jgi:hypothetical protein
MEWIPIIEENQEKIKEKWETGRYSCRTLAEEFGIKGDESLRLWLIKHGCKMKSRSACHRKYSLNEHFFDKIDTEEKAYLLGFLYADGYNHTDVSAVKINLAAKDKNMVYKIRDSLESNHPISIIKRSEDSRYMTQDVYRLVITNKNLSENLAKHGCVRAKTFKLTFPRWINKTLKRHFIRGYFDGDGSICGYIVNMVSTEKFITEVRNIFMEEIGLPFVKINDYYARKSNSNIMTLAYTGWNSTAKLYEYFYRDAHIYLNRKK